MKVGIACFSGPILLLLYELYSIEVSTEAFLLSKGLLQRVAVGKCCQVPKVPNQVPEGGESAALRCLLFAGQGIGWKLLEVVRPEILPKPKFRKPKTENEDLKTFSPKPKMTSPA